MTLFKQDILERFIVALQEIYREHPAYRYKDSEKDTKILIYPTYASVSYEERAPILLVKVGSYDAAFNDTVFNNYFEDVLDEQGRIIGKKYFQRISTYVTVIVKARAEEESSNIADELASLASFYAKHMFTQVHLNILGANVSETQEVDNANDEYQTIVNFRVDADMIMEEVFNGEAGDPEVEIQFPWDEITGYREPKTSVFPTRLDSK